MIQTNVNRSVSSTVAQQHPYARRAWRYIENDNSDVEERRKVWSRICVDYYQLALDFARRRVGNSDDARGVVQDSAVRLLRFLPDHRQIDDRRNYWMKTVSNKCNERMKQMLTAARTVSLDAPLDDDGDAMLPVDLTDHGRSPEMYAQINEETERLLAALEFHCRDLTERERTLLVLHLQGFSNDQIASIWCESGKLIRVDMNALLAKIRYRVQHAKGKTGRTNHP